MAFLNKASLFLGCMQGLLLFSSFLLSSSGGLAHSDKDHQYAITRRLQELGACVTNIGALMTCMDESGNDDACMQCLTDTQTSITPQQAVPLICGSTGVSAFCGGCDFSACDESLQDTLTCVQETFGLDCSVVSVPVASSITGGGKKGGGKKGGGGGIPPGLCFSSESTVDLEHGSTKRVGDIAVGDRVLASDGKYKLVYGFGHKDPAESAVYHQIFTSEGENPLEISSNHMVFLFGKDTPVPAIQIRVGDRLKGRDKDQGVTVTKINTISRKGAYGPFTTDGTIVVSGVTSSSYVTDGLGESEYVKLGGVNTGVSWHFVSHMYTAPRRFFCTKISQKVCEHETYDENGFPFWMVLGRFLVDLFTASQDCVWLQVTLFATVVPITFLVFSLVVLLDQFWLLALAVLAGRAAITKKDFSKKTKQA